MGTVLFVFLCSVVCALCGWSNIQSMPSYANYGTLMAFGEKAVYLSGSLAYLYDFNADTWANLPSAYPNNKAEVGSLTTVDGAMYCGGFPAIDNCYELELATETFAWSARASLPAPQHEPAGASDPPSGQYYMVGDGAAYQYYTATNAWSQRTASPIYTKWAAAEIVSSILYYFTQNLHKYNINSDIWTTMGQPPVSQQWPLRKLQYVADAFLVYGAGQVPGASATKWFSYYIAADTWTTLDNAPSPHLFTPSAYIESANTIVVFGNIDAPNVLGHKLTGPFGPAVASVVGDPVVTSFSGVAGELSLFPGVFNILSTAHLVVNALVDAAPNMPVGEDMLITAVSIVASSSSTNTANTSSSSSSSSSTPTLSVGYCSGVECQWAGDRLPILTTHSSLSVVVDGFLVTVVPKSVSLVNRQGTAVVSTGTHIDLRVRALSSIDFSTAILSGILGDAEQLGFPEVRTRLMAAHYSAEHGCVHSLARSSLSLLDSSRISDAVSSLGC